MRYFIILLLFCFTFAKEIDLYSKNGEALAYIDLDDDFIIYMWNGTPVAYIDEDSIYGFNGKHLGWFQNGIIWDNKGYAVGYMEGVFTTSFKILPIKSIKQITPIKSIPQIPPILPIFKKQWSIEDLQFYLYRGKK